MIPSIPVAEPDCVWPDEKPAHMIRTAKAIKNPRITKLLSQLQTGQQRQSSNVKGRNDEGILTIFHLVRL
jgi:hypothetical protein